jgi:hypothetical protein
MANAFCFAALTKLPAVKISGADATCTSLPPVDTTIFPVSEESSDSSSDTVGIDDVELGDFLSDALIAFDPEDSDSILEILGV